MTITYEYRETIWPSIKAALDHLQTERKDGMPAEVRAGVNFSIILGSACYLEGVLEAGLKALLRLRRVIYGRMNPKNFETRRSRFSPPVLRTSTVILGRLMTTTTNLPVCPSTSTGSLKTYLSGYTLLEGSCRAAMFDALVKDFDREGTDLLVEVKSSVETAHIRMAVELAGRAGAVYSRPNGRKNLPHHGTISIVLAILRAGPQHSHFTQSLRADANRGMGLAPLSGIYSIGPPSASFMLANIIPTESCSSTIPPA